MIEDVRVVVQLGTANFCLSMEGMGKLYRVTRFPTIKDKFKKMVLFTEKRISFILNKTPNWHQAISHSVEER